MIEYYEANGVKPEEYYISILPTGGPKGVPIFDQLLPNVLTLVFDDVEEDRIKDKWPDGVGTFMARAMTVDQAETLVKFVKTIPTNVTINVHCVDGTSRSVAVEAALTGKPVAGNPWVYRLVKELYEHS